MFRHVAMFTWNEGLAADHVAAVTAGLDALPPQIPELRSYQHGPDLGVSDGAWDYVVVADFDSADDFLTYRDHPAHQQFIADLIVGKIDRRASIQYAV